MVFFLAGFAMIVVPAVLFYKNLPEIEQHDLSADMRRLLLFIPAGFVLAISAWVWAMFTSFALVREARKPSGQV
jgi:hypothetical protein